MAKADLATGMEKSLFRPSILRRQWCPLDFPRPSGTAGWEGEYDGLVGSGEAPFRSNGGGRGHPARQLPYSVELDVPTLSGDLRRITLVGVFALFADQPGESWGTFGATVQGFSGQVESFRQNLLNGEAYTNGRDLAPVSLTNGTGLSLETIGTIELDDAEARLDALTIDLPPGTKVDRILFKDLGSPASFAIFDAFGEYEVVAGCPFRESSGGVAFGELAPIVRLGDRVRFARAMAQLDGSIEMASDLDEARGQALTFLSVLTAATLETGGTRKMIKIGLEAARELDKQQSLQEIRTVIHGYIAGVVGPTLEQNSPSSALIDRALAYVERHYARDLSDEILAANLGLSTSHFRFLFKQATGQPFHRYLIGLRLEKAKRLLLEDTISISKVASSVGFTGLSHFSRAFTARFKLSPTQFKRPGSSKRGEAE